MIAYSRSAFKAFTYLFRPYNDIDVYVEDTRSRNVYQILLTRMLDGRATVRRVFQLGGRRQVLAECTSQQQDTSRAKLFIIDGDFDLLLGRASPQLRHLYVLGVYTSENLLISESAACEIAHECLDNCDRGDVAGIVDFGNFIKSAVEVLAPLFVAYAVASALDGTLQTSGLHVSNLCDGKGGGILLSRDKVATRCGEIYAALANTSDADTIAATREQVESRMAGDYHHTARFISGKTYLLPLLLFHLRRNAKVSASSVELKARLARHTVLDVDVGLKNALLSAAKGG